MKASPPDVVKKVEAGLLLAFYGALLTPGQQEVMRLYCDEDLSLSEIAQQLGVTRQSICDTVVRAVGRLNEYEQALGLNRRFRRMEGTLGACARALDKVAPSADTKAHLENAKRLLEQALSEEEQ